VEAGIASGSKKLNFILADKLSGVVVITWRRGLHIWVKSWCRIGETDVRVRSIEPAGIGCKWQG